MADGWGREELGIVDFENHWRSFVGVHVHVVVFVVEVEDMVVGSVLDKHPYYFQPLRGHLPYLKIGSCSVCWHNLFFSYWFTLRMIRTTSPLPVVLLIFLISLFFSPPMSPLRSFPLMFHVFAMLMEKMGKAVCDGYSGVGPIRI